MMRINLAALALCGLAGIAQAFAPASLGHVATRSVARSAADDVAEFDGEVTGPIRRAFLSRSALTAAGAAAATIAGEASPAAAIFDTPVSEAWEKVRAPPSARGARRLFGVARSRRVSPRGGARIRAHARPRAPARLSLCVCLLSRTRACDPRSRALRSSCPSRRRCTTSRSTRRTTATSSARRARSSRRSTAARRGSRARSRTSTRRRRSTTGSRR